MNALNLRKLLGLFAAMALVTGSSLLSACNTMEGAGKDIEAGGKAIQKCADITDPSCKS